MQELGKETLRGLREGRGKLDRGEGNLTGERET